MTDCVDVQNKPTETVEDSMAICPPDSEQLEQNIEEKTTLIEVKCEQPEYDEHTEESLNTVTVYQPDVWQQKVTPPPRAAKRKARDKCKKIAVDDSGIDVSDRTFSVRSTCRRKHKTYYCEHCTYAIGKHDLMQSHYRTEHPKLAKMHKCTYKGCDYSCNCRKSIQAHILAIHKNVKFRCTHPDCTFETNSRTKLRYHTKSQHLAVEEFKPWKCDECELRFCHVYDLNRHHYVRHMPEKPYSCDEKDCNYKCKSTWELKSHKSQSHSDIRPYKCGQCGLRTKVLSDLRKHMIRHLNVREHQCGICDKKFICAADAKRHRDDIHSDLQIKCEYCPYIAKSRAKFRKHLEKHGSRWFSCAHCSQKYHSKSSLKQHIRTHDPDRPFPCPICEEYVATSVFTLVVHIGKLHKDYRYLYECIVCRRSYNKSCQLRQHFETDLHKMTKAADPALKDEPDDLYKGLMEKLYSVNGVKKTTKKKEKYKWADNLKGPRPKISPKSNDLVNGTSKAIPKKPPSRKRKTCEKATKSRKGNTRNKKRKGQMSNEKKDSHVGTVKEECEDTPIHDESKRKRKSNNCYATATESTCENTDQM
ncbi:unnamed protein product, partial [Owenia fusiformis]